MPLRPWSGSCGGHGRASLLDVVPELWIGALIVLVPKPAREATQCSGWRAVQALTHAAKAHRMVFGDGASTILEQHAPRTQHGCCKGYHGTPAVLDERLAWEVAASRKR